MTLRRTLLVWLLILPLMIANGIFREAVLVPAFGRTFSDVMSASIGIAIILVLTRYFLRRTRFDSGGLHPIHVSIIWLVLTVAFEFIFGHWVDRKSWSELAANYAIWRGNLWPLVLLSLVSAPFLWRSRTVTR